MIKNPSYRRFVNRVVTLRSSIILHFEHSWHGINYSQNEPDIIRDYLHSPQHGISYLNSNLGSLFTPFGYELKFGGIFIHQRPQITRVYARTHRQCELGDLLVIFSFLNEAKDPRLNRAFLVQAKKQMPFNNICQMELYDKDLEFDWPATIYSGSRCTTSPRRILPKTNYCRKNALKYLLCQPHQTEVYLPPAAHLYSRSWGDTLFGLLCSADGLRFSKIPPVGKNKWGAIVWDLIDAVSIAPIGTTGISRGRSLGHLLSFFNDYSKQEKYFYEIDGSEGIPIMLIIARSTEEN